MLRPNTSAMLKTMLSISSVRLGFASRWPRTQQSRTASPAAAGPQAQPSSGKFWCSMTSAASQPGTASRSRPVVSYCMPISRSARAVSQSGTVMTADSVTAHKTPSSSAVTMLFVFCFIRIT